MPLKSPNLKNNFTFKINHTVHQALMGKISSKALLLIAVRHVMIMKLSVTPEELYEVCLKKNFRRMYGIKKDDLFILFVLSVYYGPVIKA